MKSFIKLFFAFFIVIIINNQISAQSANTTHYNISNYLTDRYEIKSGVLADELNTDIRSYNRGNMVAFFERLDTSNSLFLSAIDRHNFAYIFKDNNELLKNHDVIESKKPFLRHFYKTPANFFEVNTKDFKLKVNPIINFHAGYQMGDSNAMRFVNQRGAEIRGSIDNVVGFYANITDNQAKFPEFYRLQVLSRNAVPNEGLIKNFKKGIGFDYYNAVGYINVRASKHISLRFGHDRHFIGNGYRSLLLSDEGSNNLFLQLNTKIWKLQYQNIFTELTRQVSFGAPDTLRGKKYGAFHYLSTNIGKNLQLGVFEGIIFSRNKFFELQYLNPIIFYRSIEHNLGSPDNVLIGANAKYNFKNSFQLYAQLCLDELKFGELRNNRGWWANKFAYQIGAKYIDVAGVSNLDVQVEYNRVRPYMYSHRYTDNNYSSYNQPMAHILGANFQELMGIVNYKPHRQLRFIGRANYIQQGLDSAGVNYGSNIFWSYDTRESDYGNYVGRGVKTNIVNMELRMIYSWKHNIDFYALAILRRQNANYTPMNRTDKYFGIGMAINAEVFKKMAL